jgi:hypothetical protein
MFEEDTETHLWLIGYMMVDFGMKRLFILYGPGNVGKTTVANIISSLSSNVVFTIPGGFITKKRNAPKHFGHSLPQQTKAELASSRLILIGDMEIEGDDEEINMQTVKECTGGDSGPSGSISVTCLMSTNQLFRYNTMSEYTQPDRTRRVVVVPTVTERATPSKQFVYRHREDGVDADCYDC